jgi:hypothetical protein
MFQNINYLNRLNKNFNISMVFKGHGHDREQYFIFIIIIDETTDKVACVIADNLITDIDTLPPLTDITKYYDFRAIENFTFVQI